MAFWSLTNRDFPTNQTFHQFHDLDIELELWRLWVVSMEHLQWVWHASRERLPFRTPGSVPPLWDLLVLQLLRPDSSNSNTPWYFLDFALNYKLLPSVQYLSTNMILGIIPWTLLLPYWLTSCKIRTCILLFTFSRWNINDIHHSMIYLI